MSKVPGRAIAWLSLATALAASVGANVANATPHLGPRLTSASAPTLVILAAGMLERLELVGAKLWQRLAVVGGLLVVIGCAFVTSYQHQYDLLIKYGNERLSATLLPIAVDALIVMSSVALAVIAQRKRAATVTTAEPTPVTPPVPAPTAPQALALVARPVSPAPVNGSAKRRVDPAEIRRLAEAGLTRADIAKRTGASERTVYRHLPPPDTET